MKLLLLTMSKFSRDETEGVLENDYFDNYFEQKQIRLCMESGNE